MILRSSLLYLSTRTRTGVRRYKLSWIEIIRSTVRPACALASRRRREGPWRAALAARGVARGLGDLAECRVASRFVAGCSAAPPGPWRNGPRTAGLDLLQYEFVASDPSRILKVKHLTFTFVDLGTPPRMTTPPRPDLTRTASARLQVGAAAARPRVP